MNERDQPMLSQEDFLLKSRTLGIKLQGLWLYTFQALTLGMTPERMAIIQRTMHEANQLHAEMFPDFEHSLYSDDYLSMLEDDDESAGE